MSDDFPAFALSEEHQALREAVRALADDKIAPRAADVDRTSEFPWDVYEALVKADFQAVHIPEAYGGAGADAIATAIVIEEVARACASSSLIPAVNKLGTVPLMIAASEDIKARYLAPVARGEAMFSYALSEPESGSDAAAMKTKAVRIDSGYVLNGVKRWIINAGVSKYYTVMAVTDPSAGANGISAFVLEDGDPGFTFGAPEHKLGIKGSPTRELYFDDCAIPADRLIGAEGEGFKVALRTLLADHRRHGGEQPHLVARPAGLPARHRPIPGPGPLADLPGGLRVRPAADGAAHYPRRSRHHRARTDRHPDRRPPRWCAGDSRRAVVPGGDLPATHPPRRDRLPHLAARASAHSR